MLQLPVYNANSEFLWCVILQVDTKQMFFYKILKLYIVKPFNNVLALCVIFCFTYLRCPSMMPWVNLNVVKYRTYQHTK